MNKDELRETLNKLDGNPEDAELFMSDRIYKAVEVLRRNPDKEPAQFADELDEIGMSVLAFEGHMEKVRRELQDTGTMDVRPRSAKAWLARYIDLHNDLGSPGAVLRRANQFKAIEIALTERADDEEIFALFSEEIGEDYIEYSDE